ncbi:hypothetical protein KC19_4G116800 [Ceratodon purpureus]|uniref:Uncharacterized protein n=1 Tax=Ceratodon purpureus TaxID=3225 RepID=A0A8T0I804_CERPU|nr:hypothetical protein KC19_4G116800 [Ceratodon purpureus]
MNQQQGHTQQRQNHSHVMQYQERDLDGLKLTISYVNPQVKLTLFKPEPQFYHNQQLDMLQKTCTYVWTISECHLISEKKSTLGAEGTV